LVSPALLSASAATIGTPVGGALALGLGTFFYGMFAPASRMFGPVIVRGARDGRPVVALTFDDGPTPEGTGPILDALARHSAPATFFFIGSNVQRHPDLVRRALAAGHQVENHSFDHAWSGVMRRGWYWKDQWARTDAAIRECGGRERCRYFRPPMGFKSWRMAVAARAAEYEMVAWSLRGLDGVSASSESILKRVLPRAAPGDIIALHDGAEPGSKRDPRATVEAMPRLVEGLRARGLTLVTLDELLKATSGGAGERTTGAAGRSA
jgi:peptidoglycan/xylan/chitin deacetylase (PgdA/CDA1 family)